MAEHIRCFGIEWYARYGAQVQTYHLLQDVRRTPGGLHPDSVEHRRAAGRMASERAKAIRIRGGSPVG
jgi:hypothetical protein